MTKILIAVLLILPAAGLVGVLTVQSADNTAPAGSAPSVLPESLARHYPPQAPGPVFLMEMIGLSTPFSGMMSDFLEGDYENAAANFEAFRAQYVKVSGLVPEWRTEYPMEPVEQLGAAIRAKDQGAVMQASEAIGRSCHGCHTRALVPAQLKFHWGDFGTITVTDPVIKQDVSFAQLMRLIESDLSGIGNDLGQGQPDNAMKHAEGLASRYETLKETCAVCHESERAYFVDERVMAMIEGLPAAMNGASSDPDGLGKLMGGIGQESCHKCHLVHLPAAYAKAMH